MVAQRGGWLTEARRKLPPGRGTAPRNTSWGGRAVVELWEPRKGGLQVGLVQGDFLEEAGFKRGQWGEASLRRGSQDICSALATFRATSAPSTPTHGPPKAHCARLWAELSGA